MRSINEEHHCIESIARRQKKYIKYLVWQKDSFSLFVSVIESICPSLVSSRNIKNKSFKWSLSRKLWQLLHSGLHQHKDIINYVKSWFTVAIMNFKLIILITFFIVAHLASQSVAGKKDSLVVINNGKGKVMYDEGKKKKGKKIMLKSDGCCGCCKKKKKKCCCH